MGGNRRARYVEYVNTERAVIHIKQMGKDVQVRFVGDQIPNIECRSVMPTLEDYYIYVNEKTKSNLVNSQELF